MRGEAFTRDGGAVLAWRALAEVAPFTHVLVGDLDPIRAAACETRLSSFGAPVTSYTGEAAHTVIRMVSEVPAGGLSIAFLDQYNLELLSFSMIKALAKLRKVDLLINFSTMDLERNGDRSLIQSVGDLMRRRPVGVRARMCSVQVSKISPWPFSSIGAGS